MSDEQRALTLREQTRIVERACLAGLLRSMQGSEHDPDYSLFRVVARMLHQRDDFVIQLHRKIWEAICDLVTAKQVVTASDVAMLMRHTGGDVRNPVTFREVIALPWEVYTSWETPHYARCVRDFARSRRVTAAGKALAELDGAADLNAELATQQEKLRALEQHDGAERCTQIGIGVLSMAENICEAVTEKRNAPGVQSGFTELDAVTMGWQPSDLIVVAGRPSMGKTSLALGSLVNAAKDHGTRSLFASIEMSEAQLQCRLLAMEARVNLTALRGYKLQSKETARVARAAPLLSRLPIHVIYDNPLTLESFVDATVSLHREVGLDIAVVDYLQKMTTEKYYASREQQIAAISDGLKSLAKELDIPVIALAQLNRGVEGRTDKRPGMSDLRESGAIEQDADVICFLYRDEWYNPDGDHKGKADVIIGKQRQGSTGTVTLRFYPEFTLFLDLPRSDQRSM